LDQRSARRPVLHDQIIVHHDKRNWLTIERLKLLGFSSDRVFACHLDTDEGQTICAFLTRRNEPGGGHVSPLGAFVQYLAECESLDEVKAACRALLAMHHGP
jgi:hypothetical protein